ncbi:hypothetical protein [Psychromonas sp. 14N.309.X.WAT.B.A12]|uniref:type IV pilus modification PilV family protein n=1 Tax=unclassified Psychromonas TaxID=2614957 RepID=UPI0025B1A868|nr:hypothetical protein [Psychromonas sp. 14N.309.X.WAT.B.A12]MDN2663342.1 hypothetical protein [Psychromonas sp. 14N.309.X.WAT.B.A12]
MVKDIQGFTFVEILVSLIIVSLTALNMSGLQIKISQQQNNNIAHASAISLATSKLEALLSANTPNDILALHNKIETDIQLSNTIFSIEWEITNVSSDFNANNQFKEINLHISWSNYLGEVQRVVYTQQINLMTVISEQFEQQVEALFPTIVTPSVAISEMLYFDPNKEYQAGDFVIYNSHVYKANGLYSNNSKPPINSTDAKIGWDSYGQIDQLNLFNH